MSESSSSKKSKKVFYRDSKGELHALKPGEENPDERREREKTDEDRHYEDYLQGKSSGAVRNIGGGYGGQYGIDKAALAASDSFLPTEDGGALMPYGSHEPAGESKLAEERKHMPAQAYNRRNKIKGKPGQAGDVGSDTHADLINAGSTKLEQALKRARADSDDDGDGDEDDDGAAVSAANLADRVMQVYNLPIPKAQQLDVYGNDLNVPKRERKMRKFLECFGEELQVKTIDGKVVLKDFDDLRKRYGAVFRESGHTLRGTVRRRFIFGARGAPARFVLDFERHESLVTPRPGLSLDGSMGVLPPRTQDLVVLYQSEAGEISAMWIAPDKLNHGGDPQLGRAELEASELFPRFRALVESRTEDTALNVNYVNYVHKLR